MEKTPARTETYAQPQPFEPVAGPRLDRVAAEAGEVREEIAIGVDDREELAIRLAIRVVDDAPSSRTMPAPVLEARDQLDQGRLAAAVSAGQDDDLAPPESQVDGPECEARVVVPVAISECHTLQADRLDGMRVARPAPAAVGLRPACRSSVGDQGLDLAERGPRPTQDRQPGQDDVERGHQIEDDQHGRDKRRPPDRPEMGHGEEQDADEAEERELAPAFGDREMLSPRTISPRTAPWSARATRRGTPRGARDGASARGTRRSGCGNGRRAHPGRPCSADAADARVDRITEAAIARAAKTTPQTKIDGDSQPM